MFGIDRKPGASRPSASVESLIGTRTEIRGDMSFAGGLHVDGRIHGVVSADGGDAVLMLSEKGQIHGEVRAPHVVINGEMNGDIYASERVELASQARVFGNIHYKVLEMAAGAQVTGQLVRTEEPLKLLTAPPPLSDEAHALAARANGNAARAHNGSGKAA